MMYVKFPLEETRLHPPLTHETLIFFVVLQIAISKLAFATWVKCGWRVPVIREERLPVLYRQQWGPVLGFDEWWLPRKL